MIYNKADIAEKKKAKLAKLKFQREKNAVRIVWRLPEWENEAGDKKPGTWEKELFERVKQNNTRFTSSGHAYVIAKHMDTNGNICEKQIWVDDLWPENYHHEKPKGMNKDLRLVEKNIMIVSFAYHFWLHNKQIMKVNYKN